PFGVALLVGGIEAGEPRLFETDPSGTPYEWKAVSIGASRGDIRDLLEEEYSEEMGLDEAVDLALTALGEVNDEGLTPEGIGVATVSVEDEQFHELDTDEIESHLVENDLLATEDEESEADGTSGEDEDGE
ncbi:proteasome subunit alpha, partial [Halobium palmae]